MPTQQAIGELYEHWLSNPDVIHGLNGRSLFFVDAHPKLFDYNPKLQNSDQSGPRTMPIMLTQMMMAKKERALEASVLAQTEEIQVFAHSESKPFWNGEDIFFFLRHRLFQHSTRRDTHRP